MKKLLILLCCTGGLLAACHNSVKEIEPSEAFRTALDEVMLRQPKDLKVKPDDLDRRKEPIILKLSFDDCIELAMTHNRTILFEQLNAEVARADVVGAKANLDFTIGANIGYNRTEEAVQSRFPGDTRDKSITGVTTFGINASLPFATGTTLDVSGTFVRNDSNSPFQSFEFYPSTTLKVTQHLLNGFGFVPNLGSSWIAENNRAVADWQVEVTRNEQALAVAMAYWNLVEAEQELDVLYRQEDLAKDALDLAKSRLEAEIGTRLDVLAQEANLKSQQVSIIQAETLVEQRTDELLHAIHPDLIHGYALYDNYSIVIEPTTNADTSRVGADEPNLLAEVKAALRRRPEIRQAAKQIENAGISINMSEYGLLPTLDLESSITISGFGKEFDDSLSSYDDFDNLKYGFDLRFGVPLQNSAARSSLTKAEISKRNAILSARETETGVILEVAAAVRQIKSTRRAVNAAEESRSLQAETYEAEQERQKAGLATSFEVKQALNDLTQAELGLVKAKINLERARLQLQKATGELGR
ncbi:MAG: TolC family protein [Planctomycetes bacterium]|nr:TolC family protein [Planctomycetota bacterium]